jgi:hypothetical protein
MKTSHFTAKVPAIQRSGSSFTPAIALGAAGLIFPMETRAEAVDSELVLLVDIVRPELSNLNFNRLRDGYSVACTSSQMMNFIQSGAVGKIAVSLMFYGGTGAQQIGVPWMSIGSAADALLFSSLVQAATRPTTFAFSDPGSALTAATNSFGSETGGAGNGFESTVQIIEAASPGIPSNSTATSTANSSANAFASGVDLINSVARGTFSASIDGFYTTNVSGSTIPGVSVTSNTAALNNALAAALTAELTTTVNNGAAVSITAVPEPSPLAMLSAAALLFLRRRRN